MTMHRIRGFAHAIALGVVLVMAATSVPASEFDDLLDRVDAGLRDNPGRMPSAAIESCHRQRNRALKLYRINQPARAMRSLEYCVQILHLGDERPHEAAQPSIAEIQARAARELEQALTLEPDLERGLEVFRGCAECHTPEGAGLGSGLVPQIAGQHRRVVIKQLADIRAGNRETVPLAPYAAVEGIGGVQAVADVAGYIDTLEITTDVDHGAGDALELGEKLYRENCARCHGANGEGDPERYAPRIHSQHFGYLVRQFERIQDGSRLNANPEMRAQVEGFEEAEMRAVLDYVSRLEPAPELQAPPNWKNPDFAN
jgi:cytochrome c553